MSFLKVFVIFFLFLFPLTTFAQRNLGNFSFGTLQQIHTQFTAKEYSMFVVIFKIIPSKKQQNVTSFHITFTNDSQLEVQNTTIQKNGDNTLLLAEVRRYEKHPKKRIEKVNATLTTTVTGITNNQPTIQNTDIPFSFDLLYR